ncbi:helix-turn-helix domain-containing protein [Mesonia maritima]|uniref:helix-turn-helix domain-containing protein n=1 Tax=Mesonia maritima TaxID=1793873 RepID=UPI0035EAC0F0
MGEQIRNIELLEKIALKIKALRNEKGLTQEEVYNDLGIHIARIEANRSNITVSTLSEICKYFSISLKDLFGEIENTK